MSSFSWIKNINTRQWIHIGVLIIAAVIFTRSSVNGELLNYDDERYIQGNELIEGLSGENVSRIFTEYFDGHYHPLTLLSLAVDSSLGDDPIRSHHALNWWLHLLNTLLVYTMLGMLFPKKWELAFGTALLFLLHPMNVESYAWMTERKNVLYSFFFLLSTIKYIQYQSSKERNDLILVYLFLVCSLLSKAQAVVLLPVFLLVDIVSGRNMKGKEIWLEKAPALVLFLAFMVVTRNAQVEAWGELSSEHSFLDKLLLSTSGYGSYLIKGLLPLSLSPYYPYPEDAGLEMGLWHFIGPVWIIITLVAGYLFWKKKEFNLFWGVSFFFLNIILMIKFLDVPFGDYYMADRYNYLPTVGLMWILVAFLSWAGKKSSLKEDQIIWLVVAYAVFLGVKASNQIEVWSNSESLWAEASRSYPDYAHAQNMLAISQLQAGKNREAGRSFEKLVQVDPQFEGGYENLATLAFREGRKKEALSYVKKALEYRDTNVTTLKLAVQIGSSEDIALALESVKKMNQIQPESESNKLLYAQVLIKDNQIDAAKSILEKLESKGAYDLITQINEQEALADPTKRKARKVMDKAIALGKAGEFESALKLFDQSISMDSTNYKSYINRASTKAQMKDFDGALKDLDLAQTMNPNDGMIYYLIGAVNKDLDNQVVACENIKKAQQLGSPIPPALLSYCP